MAIENAHNEKAHTQTYDGFIGMLKWSVPLIVVITAVVVLLIAN